MIPTIGIISLYMALCASFVQVSAPVLKIKNMSSQLVSFVIMSLVAMSFFCLLLSFVLSDFSVLNVYNNSHTLKPLIYKISGTWGNHEGSMLLFVMILAIYNFSFTKLSKLDAKLNIYIISFQTLIIIGFISYIIFTSNPFLRIFPVPENGVGLNPLLQDIGLALHPPILYIGYVGLSFGLTFSLAALIAGKADSIWAASLKKWIIFSWSFLTLGIGIGSWWAYRELGWGGYWFWDPVENASLMPWILATALMHSLIMVQKRSVLKIWTVLLGIITFSLCLVGMFLVRSGVLTSVHSFASDPTRGTYILLMLGLIVNVSLLVFAIRAGKLKDDNNFTILSREGSIVINNLLLVVLFVVVLLGTIYPLLLEIFTDYSVSVGAPYFNLTFNPIAMPLLFLAAFGPLLKYNSDNIRKVLYHIYISGVIFLSCLFIVFYVLNTHSFIAVCAISFSIGIIFSMLTILYKNFKAAKISNNLIAMILSHIGIAILVLGVTISSIWGTEEEKIIKQGEAVKISYYQIILNNVIQNAKDNYLSYTGEFAVKDEDNNQLIILNPEVRYYPVEQSTTTESDIYYRLFSNLYIALGEPNAEGGFVVRVYNKPMINLIWLGCLLMVIGGLVTMLKVRKN
jgi:cytochrome c-type biogenesis protein CcmF